MQRTYALKWKNEHAAGLSAVYRIPELFVKSLVIKTSVMNNERAVYELNRFKHKHYAVCTRRRKMIAMDNCPVDKFTPHLEDKDFRIMGHNLEIFGLCKDCNAK